MNKKNSPTNLFKIEAKALRKYLGEQGIELGHSKCLEAVARMHGFKNWDTAAFADVADVEQVPASTQEARSMARAIRSEAGWEASWLFPWELSKPPQGTTETTSSKRSGTVEELKQFQTVRELLDELVYYDMGGDSETNYHNGLERYKLLSVTPYDDLMTLHVGFKIEVVDEYLDKKIETVLCIHMRDARKCGAWGRALSTSEGRAYVSGHWNKAIYWMQESPRDEQHGIVLFNP